MGWIKLEAGIGLLIAATIWGILLVNPKSPVKKRWWSNSKLSIAIDGEATYSHEHILRVDMDIMALSEVDIESIYLELKGKHLSSDWDSNSKPYWESRGKAGHDCLEICFDIPDWVPSGRHTVRLIAITEEGRSKSPTFTIDIPDKENNQDLA